MGVTQATLAIVALTLVASTLAQRGQYRSLDGTNNSLTNPTWGVANTVFARTQTQAAYAEPSGNTLTGSDRPGPREISLVLMKTNYPEKRRYEDKRTSDLLTYIGHFYDHDIDKTLDGNGTETAPIPIPQGDMFFDPQGLGNLTMSFTRSAGRLVNGQREMINTITAYVDGSIVYGSSVEIANKLRSFKGGRMLTINNGSLGDMLPSVGSINMTLGRMANDAGRLPPSMLKAAGDVRGNVNPPILTLQTLWAREHNRIAGELAAQHPDWSDEELFQEARKWNIAYLQHVCFNEYMTALGVILPPYTGYNASVDPSIDLFFTTVAYRYGHSEVTDVLLRIDDDGNEIPQGHLLLQNAYFNPQVALSAGIDPLLRGMTTQVQGFVEPRFSSAVQNFLFGLPGVNGSDLFARDIQRGRDHGIPDYNTCRQQMGLKKIANFSELTNDTAIADALTSLYGTPDRCDAFVCGLAEPKVKGSHFGELFMASMQDQYRRLRDGDWWYFENTENGQFNQTELATIGKTGLRDVILRNTNITVLPESLWVVDPKFPWPSTCSATNGTGGNTTAQSVSLAGGQYTLSWSFPTVQNTDMAEFTISAPSGGWVALGFAVDASSGMTGAHVVMVNPAAQTIMDAVATGHSPPQAAAKTSGCSQVSKLVSAASSGGVTTVTFQRPLTAVDACHRAVTPDATNFLIYSWNPDSADFTQYHGASHRGMASIDLSTTGGGDVAEDDGGDEYSILRKHGILMAIAFCIMLPLAALSNRIKSSRLVEPNSVGQKAFFYLHIFFNVVGVTLAAAGFGYVLHKFGEPYGQMEFSHGSFGVAIMAVLFLQILYPWLRPKPEPLTLLRRLWELLHTTLGWSILVMAWVNVALGIVLFYENFQTLRMFACLAAIPVCTVGVALSVVDRLSSQAARSGSAYEQKDGNGGAAAKTDLP